MNNPLRFFSPVTRHQQFNIQFSSSLKNDIFLSFRISCMYGSSCGYVYVSAGILQRPEVTDSPGTGVTRIASCPTLCREPQSPGSVSMVSLTSGPYLKSSVLILIHYTAKCAFPFREQKVATGSHPHPGSITPTSPNPSTCFSLDEQKWYVAFLVRPEGECITSQLSFPFHQLDSLEDEALGED